VRITSNHLFLQLRIRKVAVGQGGDDQATSAGSGAIFFVFWLMAKE
jgi:hypothetical protein